MSAQQLNDLWNLVRENEKTIALLAQRVGDQSEDIRKLRDDNDKMRAILNQAIGAKTVVSFVGAAVVAVITWALTYYGGKN